MSIEVIEKREDYWNVYFTLDKDEKCCCDSGTGCGEIQITFDTQAKANEFAAFLRFTPGGYQSAVDHWTTKTDDPLAKVCGCHEEIRDQFYYWIEEATCLYAQILGDLWYG